MIGRAFVGLLSTLLITATGGRNTTAAEPEGAVLTIRVADLRNDRGHLRLGVFDRAKGFPRERSAALLWRSLPADAGGVTFEVELPPGKYAAVILHDENSNKKLDTNFIGVPTEGHGVTNNPKPRFRAATFREAAFTLPPEGVKQKVRLQYY